MGDFFIIFIIFRSGFSCCPVWTSSSPGVTAFDQKRAAVLYDSPASHTEALEDLKRLCETWSSKRTSDDSSSISPAFQGPLSVFIPPTRDS